MIEVVDFKGERCELFPLYWHPGKRAYLFAARKAWLPRYSMLPLPVFLDWWL